MNHLIRVHFGMPLIFEVSRGYYSKYEDIIRTEWVSTRVIHELDFIEDENVDRDYDVAVSQIGNIVQALAFSGHEKDLEEILGEYSALTPIGNSRADKRENFRYSDIPSFQEFALLGAIRSRNHKLIDKFIPRTHNTHVTTTHLFAVLHDRVNLEEDVKLIDFLHSKMISTLM